MRRVTMAAARLCGSLALVLLVLAALVGPTQMAFADSETCETECAGTCAGQPEPQYSYCYNQCVAKCYAATKNCESLECIDFDGTCTKSCRDERCDPGMLTWKCKDTTKVCKCTAP
jgi:hypothetical protein